MRKITSMTMLLSFVLLILTSIILYIVPHGRVAYWADWRFWGLTKTQWTDQHLNLGILFLIAGFLHLYYNWKPITAYMKNKAREMKVFTASFNVALVLCLVIGIGTFFHVPPMSTVLNFSESIKEAASEKYGEPPYGHAELSSLKIFLKKVNLDQEKSIALLEQGNIQYALDQTVGEIAANNGLTPKELHEMMKAAVVETEVQEFPDTPLPGFGRKKLGEICSLYGLTEDAVIQGLAAKGFTASPDQSIKDIAASADMDPHAFFEVLYAVVQSL